MVRGSTITSRDSRLAHSFRLTSACLDRALSTPDGVSTSGSAFAFSMFSDPAGTIPALTTDTTDGFALTVGVNLDGDNHGQRTCQHKRPLGTPTQRGARTEQSLVVGGGDRPLARVPSPAATAVKRRLNRDWRHRRSADDRNALVCIEP